jgi:hypothetical protein
MRFVFLSKPFSDEPMYTRVGYENDVSRWFDERDIHQEEGQWYWLDASGHLHKIEVGDKVDINTDDEAPFYFAAAPIMANGIRVGEVVYTDH